LAVKPLRLRSWYRRTWGLRAPRPLDLQGPGGARYGAGWAERCGRATMRAGLGRTLAGM
jgi:hypothetical protein